MVVTATRADSQCVGELRQRITERRYDEARAAAQAQLNASSSNDAAIDCMGRVLLAQGKSGDAVDWFEKAVKLNRNNAQHHEGLGMALLVEGSKASVFRRPFIIRRVKTEFETAVALDPTVVDARRGLVMFYSMAPGAMGGSIEKAREQAEALMKLNPMRGHSAFGLIAERSHDLAGAEKEFLAAIALHPDSIAPYIATGAFYERQKRNADAVVMFQRVLSLDPANDDAKKELVSLTREKR